MRFSPPPLGVLVVTLLAGCAGGQPPVPAPTHIPAPDPAQVERVLFLVGDPGLARSGNYPIMRRLRQDIEWWAERLPADSAVTVLYLGDIVYPLGLNPPGTELFPHDSAIVMDQVDLVRGPFAGSRHAQAYFMAGNHDWGLKKEWEGYVRLKTLDAFLQKARAETGAIVQLAPAAGTGSPYVLDLGRNLRIIMLDTAWWVLSAARGWSPERAKVLQAIERALETAGDREVLVAAHHPFKSAGPHGGEFSFWRTLGVRYLLARSGAILQDLSSVPFAEFQQGIQAIFSRTGPPLAFIGGHEHSLQVIGQAKPTDPRFTIVSGSATKLSSIGAEKAMYFGRSAPGYMRLVVSRDGAMSLFVEATAPEFRACPEADPEREACMVAGVAAYEVVHSQRLR